MAGYNQPLKKSRDPFPVALIEVLYIISRHSRASENPEENH